MRFEKKFLSAVLGCLLLMSVGCNTDKTNPVGSAFINRDPGRVVDLPAIPMTSGQTFQELVFPVSLGQREELLVGQMNGFVFRSLLRFRVPVDSLAQVAGKTAADLVVDSVRVDVSIRSERMKENAQVAALSPQTPWEEIQTFVDSLALTEKQVLADPIDGAFTRIENDTSLAIFLPPAYVDAARSKDAQTPNVELMLQPDGSGEFLLDLIARDAISVTDFERHPHLAIKYHVGDSTGVFSTEPVADTYWNARLNGGPPRNLLLMSRGTFFGTLLKFALPDSIPKGATINSATLAFDIDTDRSFFTSFPFEIYHVTIANAGADTLYTMGAVGTTQQNLAVGQTSFIFNQALVEAWISGAAVNNGMALTPIGLTKPPTLLDAAGDVNWVVFRDIRLKLVYSLPPEL